MTTQDGPTGSENPYWGRAESAAAERLISAALTEDLGDYSDDGAVDADITTAATIPAETVGRVHICGRRPGVAAGLPLIEQVLRDIAAWESQAAEIKLCIRDGDPFDADGRLATVSRDLRGLLVAERTILNFLQRLSGIATLTRRYVDAVAGTDAVILDTRKTTPGWRVLEKYAVRCGGGTNHRMGLYDGVLIKDNHLAAAGVATADLGSWLTDVVRPKCVDAAGRPLPLEIEVDTLDQFRAVLPARPDIVLLDNMRPDVLRDAVKIRDDSGLPVLLEASGGVNLETVRPIAETGVERISVGALTHSATALDLGFDWAET